MATATTEKVRERRRIKYNTLDEWFADAEKLAAGKHETVGNWTYGQILDHLGMTFEYSVDGFPRVMPWFIRKLAVWKYKPIMLEKGLKPGVKLPKRLNGLMPSDSATIAASLDRCRNAVARYRSETKRSMHPFFGQMTGEEWDKMHLHHTALHMSFVRPVE